MPEKDYYDSKDWLNLPKPTLNTIFNPFMNPDDLYAPNWWRNLIAGKPSKEDNGAGARERMPWATKSWQALNYAGLLGLLGYGSRKLLRGASPEMQDALKAIDKYVPKGENPAQIDESRLVDKDKYVDPKTKIKRVLKRIFSFKDATDDFNSLSYALPPMAAFLAWMVGQKLAEKEIENTDLSDSKARLAKARSDYDRTLAMKLNPKARIQEKVIQDRMIQNPIDYAIDKGIALKDKAGAYLKDKLMVDDPYGVEKTAAEPANPADPRPNWKTDDDVRRQQWREAARRNPNMALAAKYLLDNVGITPFLMAFGVASFLGAGMYGYNNQLSTDKGRQKALDVEASVKRRAMDSNDQVLDIAKIVPGAK